MINSLEWQDRASRQTPAVTERDPCGWPVVPSSAGAPPLSGTVVRPARPDILPMRSGRSILLGRHTETVKALWHRSLSYFLPHLSKKKESVTTQGCSAFTLLFSLGRSRWGAPASPSRSSPSGSTVLIACGHLEDMASSSGKRCPSAQGAGRGAGWKHGGLSLFPCPAPTPSCCPLARPRQSLARAAHDVRGLSP